VAWRPGQDVVLSGHEASSHYRCPFHVTLCGKCWGLALTGGCPRDWAGRAQLGPAS